jgi:hypothetical protein
LNELLSDILIDLLVVMVEKVEEVEKVKMYEKVVLLIVNNIQI